MGTCDVEGPHYDCGMPVVVKGLLDDCLMTVGMGERGKCEYFWVDELHTTKFVSLTLWWEYDGIIYRRLLVGQTRFTGGEGGVVGGGAMDWLPLLTLIGEPG